MPRRRSRLGKRLDHLVGTRAGGWFFTTIAPPIDKVLMPLTRGRVRLSVTKPTLLLHTTGAKSGEPRTSPVIFCRDGDRVVVIASNGGNPRHPSWYHNLHAHPRCELSIRGKRRPYVARRVEGEERERLWRQGVDLYEGWLDYDARANRDIPVIVLEPAG
jgi:F420H(2)-dependent quinone reductase